MLEQVRAFADKYGMIGQGETVVAGVSGGPDSVCLFFLLKELCLEREAHLYAVHVHHGLRGAEADGDEYFARELCEREQVPLRVFSFDVRERAARERLSLEEAGRLCRYEAFREEAERLGGARIAVAHHMDDQAETVLFHLFRGTGIRGLCGMDPVRGDIIRPLLCVRRSEILEWLQQKKLSWRTDSTNASTEYMRNRIRGELLPYVRQYMNPQADRHVAEAARELSEVEEFLERKTEEAFRLCVRMEEQACFLFENGFSSLDPVIRKRLLRRCMEETGGLRDVERVHIRMLEELMDKQTGSQADLPGGRSARREYQGISLGKRTDSPAGAVLIPHIPGQTADDGHVWHFSLEMAQKDQIIPQKTYTKWFDYDKIEKYLEIRGREPGDYLEINREHGRKKLKSYLIDNKIPAGERERLRLLADGSHIVWIPGYRISERYKVTENTERILRVQIDGGE